MRQFVRHDGRNLGAGQRLEEAVSNRDRGMVGVTAGHERVGLEGVDDVGAGARHVGLHRQPVAVGDKGADHRGCVVGRHFPCIVEFEHDLLGVPEDNEVEAEGDQRADQRPVSSGDPPSQPRKGEVDQQHQSGGLEIAHGSSLTR